MKKKFKLSNRAFSLIEILIALIIIGILVFLARPKYLDYVYKAYYKKILADTYSLEDLTKAYIVDREEDPANLTKAGFEASFKNILDPDKPVALELKPGIEEFGGYKVDGRLGETKHRLEEESSTRLEDITGYYRLDRAYIDEKISTSLKGDFYVNKLGEIVYIDGNPSLEEELLEKDLAWEEPFIPFIPGEDTGPKDPEEEDGGGSLIDPEDKEEEEEWPEPEPEFPEEEPDEEEIFVDDGKGRIYFVYVDDELIKSWKKQRAGGWQGPIDAYEHGYTSERAYMEKFITEELEGNCLAYNCSNKYRLEHNLRNLPTHVRPEDLAFCFTSRSQGRTVHNIGAQANRVRDLKNAGIEKVKLVGFAPTPHDYQGSYGPKEVNAWFNEIGNHYKDNPINDFRFKDNIVYFGDNSFVTRVKFTGDFNLNKTRYIAASGLRAAAPDEKLGIPNLELMSRDAFQQAEVSGNFIANKLTSIGGNSFYKSRFRGEFYAPELTSIGGSIPNRFTMGSSPFGGNFYAPKLQAIGVRGFDKNTLSFKKIYPEEFEEYFYNRNKETWP